jgi:hypothetical protein
MSRGISTNHNVGSQAVCLKQAGVDFVFRYYSLTTHQPEKRLTKPEADALSAAGLQLGVVYEDGPTDARYFSNSRGQQDGANAYHYASLLKQPTGSAIYFAVDYDASAGDVQGVITDYFNGVVQGMTKASGGNLSYLVGVYGSGLVCGSIKSNVSGVTFAWLAESTGWTNSFAYDDWDVKQIVATSPLCSLTIQGYEDCQSDGEFGGFQTA